MLFINIAMLVCAPTAMHNCVNVYAAKTITLDVEASETINNAKQISWRMRDFLQTSK